MQFIRTMWECKNINGTKGTLTALALFLVIIIGAFVFRVGCYVSDIGKRINTWCSRKLERLNTWRT